ncbi:MAG: aspartate--tRNA ligase [Cytophagales bacterium]|nr:aspartate--tRNA ligase [Cytophagales bacterium]
MYRTHTAGELRISHVGLQVTLCGWVQRIRDKGSMIWIDLRDRYGITQLMIEENTQPQLAKTARTLGREYVVQVSGTVIERISKNEKIPTGDIEILISDITLLNASKTPPFIIEDDTDGGEDLRMKYRYLDLRRNIVRRGLELRHRMAQEVRKYMDINGFIEVETPVLIKSTPEGARDFVVPSRLHAGEFYALPQSPQTFKQLLMVSGFDKYFQIVKCFRDEDLRADRQPEFTQIDCEMSFVQRDDVLSMFEGLVRHLFKTIKNIELAPLSHMTYAHAMRYYGSDKPDIRFEMKFCELKSKGLFTNGQDAVDFTSGKNFVVFDSAELVIGINATGCASYTRKQTDELTEWIKRPQIGAKGLVYVKVEADGIKSSIDKFYSQEELQNWVSLFQAKTGDMILILAGDDIKTRKQLSELRLEMGTRLGLRDKNTFAAHWVIDFPLLEWDDTEGRWNAMHHPFTSPVPQDIALLSTNPGGVKANAYDMVINGWEVGGGSIRIHDRNIQEKMFEILGFTPDEAKAQFGFLMDAFEYGAPPHGGLAFGFDRLCSLFGGADTIRDYIAFPKNNAGKDMMIDSPSAIHQKQLDELHIGIKK